MFREAFDNLINLHHRKMTLVRLNPSATMPIKVAPSNYSRNLAGPEAIQFEGREFIIPRSQLKAPFIPLRRGDRLVDTEMGTMSITEINEQFDLGGAILGYRVRTE
jgi:hypothetical protein